ncbi:hypothetical protein F5879DRAFT_957810 [Lentinula edodes]|nr:hypothetical protein HHX47_DHR9000091 [Lentinula edodes]KAJ3903856.1 hypothetical protein F5879DRAFT_957810 [Lentinula edodes]
MGSSTADNTVLQKRLDEAERLEVELKRAYDAQHDLVVNLRNSLTAVHQFPPEILSEIFCAYMEANRDTPLAQLLLMHVCRIWRQTALENTPRIWAYLYLTIRANTTIEYGSIITECLSRSSLPADIHIDTRTSPLKKYVRSLKLIPSGIIDALVPICSRIRTLTLQGPLKNFLPLINLPRNSFPVLTELDCNILVDSNGERISAFEGSALQELRWRCGGVDAGLGPSIFSSNGSIFWGTLASLAFDATQVTTLYLTDNLSYHGNDTWNILARFTNLVSCTLYTPFFETDLVNGITFAKLTTLIMFCDYEEILVRSKMLSLLTLPSLTKLCIKFAGANNPTRATIAPTLIDLLQRSQCPLAHLSIIRAESLTNKDLSSIIDSFSSILHSFTIVGRKIIPKNFLQKLVCKKNKDPPLPNLECLRFGIYTKADPVNLAPKLFLDIVESRLLEREMSRFHVLSPLKKVQIVLIDSKNPLEEFLSLDSEDDSDPGSGLLSFLPQMPQNSGPPYSWLGTFNTTEVTRLQRLQSEGLEIEESHDINSLPLLS